MIFGILYWFQDKVLQFARTHTLQLLIGVAVLIGVVLFIMLLIFLYARKKPKAAAKPAEPEGEEEEEEAAAEAPAAPEKVHQSLSRVIMRLDPIYLRASSNWPYKHRE